MGSVWVQPLAAGLTLLLLGGVMADKRLFHSPPRDAEPYHARIRAVAAELPMRAGSWVGEDVEVPQAAIRILHPNVIISRRYREVHSGREAKFLVVQCRDARDLLGHYPPVCYVGQGWTLKKSVRKDHEIDGLKVEGMGYQFVAHSLDRDSVLIVDNFMMLPDGSTCPDMDGVTASARDYRRKFFGATQVQVITDPSFTEEEREELVRLFVRVYRPLLDAIGEGVSHE